MCLGIPVKIIAIRDGVIIDTGPDKELMGRYLAAESEMRDFFDQPPQG